MIHTINLVLLLVIPAAVVLHYHPNPGKILSRLHFSCFSLTNPYIASTVKSVLNDHLKRRPKNDFQDQFTLYAGQKYCRMLQESILQYFRPSLSYHLSLRPLFCLMLSGRLRQVLLYKLNTSQSYNLWLASNLSAQFIIIFIKALDSRCQERGNILSDV